uniref:Uncharacterized protein n=1 Tax=Anguilla anguilla TaxID=7936 RepID=A0A0E9UFR1_ANGAN
MKPFSGEGKSKSVLLDCNLFTTLIMMIDCTLCSLYIL